MRSPDRPRARGGDDASADASEPALAVLFDEIPVALGVPFVNLIFRRLAKWPDYLAEVWRRSQPLLATAEFRQAAKTLGELADPVGPITIALPADATQADLEQARRLTEVYAYVQPKLLLLTAGWAAGLAGEPLPRPAKPRGPAVPIDAFGPDADVPMVDLPPADPTVARTFESMVERRRHPGVASYYRSLANWPTLLSACWEALEPVTASPGYLLRSKELATTGTSLATSLGLHQAGAIQTDFAGELAALLATWRDVQAPQLMLDTRHLRRGLASVSAATDRGQGSSRG